MKVPLLDLKRQYQSIKGEIDAAVHEVLDAQVFIKGPKVAEFEKLAAAYCRTKRAVGCASGTDALLLALMAYEIGDGDEVITTPYTFFATAGSIARTGAVPVFADVDRRTYNLDPAKVAAAVTKKTRAIMPVHLYGQCADMDPIMEIAEKHKLVVVEDAAQAIGAEYKGRRAGSIGHIGCFSFFPSKNLGGFGDGGLMTTADDSIADKLLSLREHGQEEKYFYWTVGLNSRLDALQAAVLTVKLRHLDAWSDGRARNAEYYNKRFSGTKVVPPTCEHGNRHIYNQYMIRVKDRDGLQAHLGSKGIGSALYYPLSLHLQKCFASLGYHEGDFPESEGASKETISIPVFSLLTDEEKDYVATTVLEYVEGRAS
jgi:dTDP-4-amino-4,6-dideoxygalactose transaminase